MVCCRRREGRCGETEAEEAGEAGEPMGDGGLTSVAKEAADGKECPWECRAAWMRESGGVRLPPPLLLLLPRLLTLLKVDDDEDDDEDWDTAFLAAEGRAACICRNALVSSDSVAHTSRSRPRSSWMRACSPGPSVSTDEEEFEERVVDLN